MNNIINKINFKDCCEIINNEEIYIKDIKNNTCVISNKGDFHFNITNKNKKDISFLKIDKCVFNDGDGEKCDCAIADDELIFFIEIKELENFESHHKRSKKRKKAKDQLIETINIFKEKYLEIDLKKVFGVIALQPKIDDNYIKIITSKEQTVIDDFIEKCGCPNVFEGNYIEFK